MDNQNQSPAKSTLYIRIIIGIYLLYIDYTLIFRDKAISPNEKIIMVVMVIIFAVSAIVLIASSVKSLNAMNKE